MKSLKVIGTLGLAVVVAVAPLQYISAESLSSIRDKQSEVKSKKADAIKEKASLDAKQKKVEMEMKSIDSKLEATNAKLRQKQSEISTSQEQITKLKKEITVLKDRIAKRNELLKERMRSLQVSGGGVNYVEVLFGSQSFGDFLRRLTAVSTIVDADNAILEEQKADQKTLEKNEKAVQTKLEQQEKDKVELQGLKDDLKSQNAIKESLLNKISKNKKALTNEIESLEEREAILAAQEKAMKAEIERQKKEQQQQQNNNNGNSGNSGNSGGNSNSGGSGGGNVTSPPASSGIFQRPAVGPVTSEFSPRWGSFHYGIDIGKRGSSVSIHAAASGTVISSYYSSSYGNVVFISHNINGRTYTTVYAHMESRGVSAGQQVSRGQFIGYMGNTGQSFGAHLHFEIHEGPWNGAKSNAVNPRKYVSF